jgi:heme/copper-type cytochrome/quinol oxidase subunit 1
MEDALKRRFRKVGLGLAAGGVVLQVLGLVGMVRFYARYIGRLETATGEQLARAAALPHIATVLGTGLCVFGLVLLFRSRRLHSID